MALVHYLLVYDHRTQRLAEEPRAFADGGEAAAAYAKLEAAHRGDEDLEIVLVGADSLDTIMRTHGHYFTSVENPFPELAVAK